MAQVSALLRPEAEKHRAANRGCYAAAPVKPSPNGSGSLQNRCRSRIDQRRNHVEQGHRSAPRAAGAGGAAQSLPRDLAPRPTTTLRTEDRKLFWKPKPGGGKGVLRRQQGPTSCRDNSGQHSSISGPSSAARSGDRASDPGPTKSQSSRRRSQGTTGTDEE